MQKILPFLSILILLLFSMSFAQTNEWMTDYAVFDDADNGPGLQVSSVAAIGPDRFVALVANTPDSPILENLFAPPSNYLVGYWDADSGMGRVPSPINGEQIQPPYNSTEPLFSTWEFILDKIDLTGAWQVAADSMGRIYVANNDEAHNILVYELTAEGVVATENRMETGTENIFGIEVDSAGYVYVVDYMGDDVKTNEVKVFAPIGAEGTTWGTFGGHTDDPTTTIDLPVGMYQGITVNNDGSEVFVSASSERSVLKFVGDPESGYTQDMEFSYTMSPDDTVSNGNSSIPTVLGMAYMDDPELVFVAVDTFISIGMSGGYPYGRIYALDPVSGSVIDTVDVAEWNFEITGAYDTGSNNGRAGGFTSVVDVDVEPVEKALYTQTYYGWAPEKWMFDGVLNDLIGSVEKVSYAVPAQFNLKQNYPNPFNPVTTIEFDIREPGFVALEIYNTMGQKIATMMEGDFTPGSYKVDFDGSQLASGVYYYQLRAGNHTSVKKMILTK